MDKAGIDYGRGMANVSKDGEYRYGCISVHSLASWVYGEAEPLYPEEVEIDCPECGHTFDTDNLCPDDYQTCPECEHEFRARSLDMLEPIGCKPELGDEYETEFSESLMCFILTKSPYYTECKYCSPCVPGAGDLDNPIEGGAKTYAFGPECFDEDSPMPYTVRDVVSHWYGTWQSIHLAIKPGDVATMPRSGAADEAIETIAKLPYIAEQTAKWDADELAKELLEYGAWDVIQCADHDANILRMLWIACCDIREGNN